VTLRARLTAAFLAVVLGPVLLGAVFVGVTVGAVSRNRSVERLDLAATAVRTGLDAACQRLRAAADGAAVLAGSALLRPAAELTVAEQVVTRGLASGVQLLRADGTEAYASPALPAKPWADCGGNPAEPGGFAGLSARVELRDQTGAPAGYVVAVERLDLDLVGRLAAASGAAVTVLTTGPGAPPLSTEAPGELAGVAGAARELRAGVAETETGRYVRRLDPAPGQPLPLALSVPRGDPQRLYAVLIAVVVLAGLLAVVAAWWLARTTIRPLTELARAVERVAAGDLAARVPVRTVDEVGRLGATFNRMTREMQGYVQALTTSRDQLRGHLGMLGDTLSSTHDLNRILEVILQTALAATGAQAGVLLLHDPETGELVGSCAEGLGDRAPAALDQLRVPVGEGLLGWVAATGEARRGRVDRDAPMLSPREPTCRTYMAVPFAAPGVGPLPGPTAGVNGASAPVDDDAPPTGRGVLALYDRHGFDEFDDADVGTLRTFAGQAAVALDNVRVHEEAQRLSLTDPLTGLSNYRYLKESLRREVERAARFGRTVAVLAMDLDHFKDVNDSHGHAAGDAVLAEFARRVRAEIREVDLAFRQGGEEFVVLLPETDSQGGAVVAERLATAIRRTPVLVRPERATETLRIAATVSIGIAVYPDHGATGQSVLEAADDALYAAKAGGRDTYRVARRLAPVDTLRGPAPEPLRGPAPEPLRGRHAAADDGPVEPEAGVTAATAAGTGALNGSQPPRQSRGG
jgi:diguanylate cyclase (GGDEF)-like protein